MQGKWHARPTCIYWVAYCKYLTWTSLLVLNHPPQIEEGQKRPRTHHTFQTVSSLFHYQPPKMVIPPPPSPLPEFVYKITLEAPPSPIPESYPLSELDQKDGFVHLSTSWQVRCSIISTSMSERANPSFPKPQRSQQQPASSFKMSSLSTSSSCAWPTLTRPASSGTRLRIPTGARTCTATLGLRMSSM